jgi:DNA-binding PadR family transcriptional regulator
VDERSVLRPVDFLVLLALHKQPRHGYGIVKDIEALSEGRVRLVPGNLYSVLSRLLDWGLIAQAPSAAGDDRRRDYRITALGRKSLRAETGRLQRLLAKAGAAGL